MKFLPVLLGGAVPALVYAAAAEAQVPPFTVVNGQCTAKSHIASGPATADLRNLQRPYSCDSTVVSVNASTGGVMVQFANRRSTSQGPLGFAGRFETPYLLKVDRVYLKPGQAVVPNEGFCRLWNGDNDPGSLARFTAILCSAQIDQGDLRTVPFVLFRAK